MQDKLRQAQTLGDAVSVFRLQDGPAAPQPDAVSLRKEMRQRPLAAV